MGRVNKEYPDVRNKMRPGDIIAFSGKGHFSEIIKWATRSSVSHVAIILQSKLLIEGEPQNGFFNEVIESTSLNGFSGVAISRLSDRIYSYDGDIWWLPLSDKIREKLDLKLFYDFLLHQERKEYDVPQAIKSAVDTIDNIPLIGAATYNIEDFSKFFCSELAAAGLEYGGALSHVNCSEVTPIDLCMFSLYQNSYYQLKGDDKDIRGFNTLDPAGWGE